VVPAFGWKEEEPIFRGVVRTRLGGGLRVYLDRPWFSSGENELLAVVLWPYGLGRSGIPRAPLPDEMKPFVTQFGLDPIWSSASVNPYLIQQDLAAPRPHGFVDPVTREKLLLAEMNTDPRPRVNVAAFVPEWSEERRLWYCDIQIRPHKLVTYFPFVRLALARYQPYSLLGCELSPVVLADFAQLVPDRRLTIRHEDDGNVRVSLVGYSWQHDDLPEGFTSSDVEVALEIRTDNAIDEPVGWQPKATQWLERVAGTQEDADLLLPGGHTDHLYKWQGRVNCNLGCTGLPGTRHVRLVVKEYEYFKGDRLAADSAETEDRPPVLARRVVYADAVVIS
jgi:hypothetical protein